MTGIALFCSLYPASVQKRERVLTHLQRFLPYYRNPKAHCTTWSYFTPAGRAPFNRLPNGDRLTSSSKNTAASRDGFDAVLAGFEIYTDKVALQQQLDDPNFQEYHRTVKEEQLYARDEELVAWYRAGGFVARSNVSPKNGCGVVVVVALMRVKEASQQEEAVATMSRFADWIKNNEMDTLSYAIFTRPKAGDEILVFERYTCVDSFNRHRETNNFKAMSRLINISLANVALAEYTEVDGSFVSNIEGGGRSSSDPESKL